MGAGIIWLVVLFILVVVLLSSGVYCNYHNKGDSDHTIGGCFNR